MFELEPGSGEVARRLPPELADKLRETLSEALNMPRSAQLGHSAGVTVWLRGVESIEYVATYFDDEKYKVVAEKYAGLPLAVEATCEGIVVSVGVRPYKDGVPINGPSEDGLPYAVSIISEEAAKRALQ